MILFINDIKISIKKDSTTVKVSNYSTIFSTISPDVWHMLSDNCLILFPKSMAARALFDHLEAKNHGLKQMTIITKNPKEFAKKVFSDHETIKAGGGIVVNPEGKILLIHRNGAWDIPKGKLEKGEKIHDCSVREVQEECKVKVSLGGFITDTKHTYVGSKKRVLKISSWYEMFIVDDSKMKPQKKEGIDKVEWKTKEEAYALLKESFSSLTWLLDEYYRLKGTNSFMSLPNL